MDRRGISEDSSRWDNRLARLLNLNVVANTAGHQWVTSNSEARVSELGCDLLDDDSDVSHVDGLLYPGDPTLNYLPNYTYFAGKIMNGKDPVLPDPLVMANVLPDSENVQIGLDQFVTAMDHFCSACEAGTLTGVDQFKTNNYLDDRVDAYYGELSSLGFIRYLIDQHWTNTEDASNLLRSNLMEPLP